jgi:hypothetical protein
MHATMGTGENFLLIFELDTRWDEWSGSRSGRALPPGKNDGTHSTGGCLGLRAGLDTEATGKILVSAGNQTPAFQSVVRHYTD